MTKIKILPSTSSECGRYSALENLQYGSIIDVGIVGKCAFILGQILIDIGADESKINCVAKYMWADFEIIGQQ